MNYRHLHVGISDDTFGNQKREAERTFSLSRISLTSFTGLKVTTRGLHQAAKTQTFIYKVLMRFQWRSKQSNRALLLRSYETRYSAG
jgi:hypothetical protein